MPRPIVWSDSMIWDLLLWAPIRLLKPYLQPVTDMLDSMADGANAAAEEYAREHFGKE